MTWVSSGAERLYAEVTGAGAPLVLLHGWPLDHRIFAPQIPAFARHFRVIAPDRRGFGRSRATPSLSAELDDLDRIIDQLADQPVHLLGMSQGGRIALRYAATRRERVRSLILQGAVVDGLRVDADDEAIPLAEYADLARAGRLDEVRERWLDHPLMHLEPGQREGRALVRSILADYRGSDLLGFEPGGYRFELDLPAALPDLARPVLILTGDHESAARRAHAAYLEATLTDVREVVLRDAGHLCNLTAAAEYNRQVLDFLRDRS